MTAVRVGVGQEDDELHLFPPKVSLSVPAIGYLDRVLGHPPQPSQSPVHVLPPGPTTMVRG